MENPNNQELTFEEAVNAISKKDDDGNIPPPEQDPKKTAPNNTVGMMR